MASLRKSSRIAIVGGGVGGFTLANLLQQSGFENVKVFERSSCLKTRGGHISIMPAQLGGALPVLERLGLDKEVLALVGTTNSFKSIVNGHIVTEEPNINLGPRIMREALQEVLLQKLQPETVVFGKQLSKCQEEEDHVKLHFQGGEVEDFELVVAADGINSTIAEGLFPGCGKQFSGFVTYCCLAKGEYLPDGFYDHHIHGGGKGFTVRAVKGYGSDGRWDGVYFTVRSSTPVPNSWEAEGTKAEIQPLLAAFDDYAGGCPEWLKQLVADSERVMKWGIYEHAQKPTWISPGSKIVLTGDAAHAMAPYLGLGAQSAMIDADVLVKELLKETSLAESLLAYEGQRKHACEAIIANANFEGLGITSYGVAASYRTATKVVVNQTVNRLQNSSSWLPKQGAAVCRAAWQFGHYTSERLNAVWV